MSEGRAHRPACPADPDNYFHNPAAACICDRPLTGAEVAARLRLVRFRWANEAELQESLALALVAMGAQGVVPEAPLDPHGRIDFFLPGGVGIEVKVDGSPSAVTRQLMGYARHEAITELVLVTTRSSHRSVPLTVNHKQVHAVELWRHL